MNFEIQMEIDISSMTEYIIWLFQKTGDRENQKRIIALLTCVLFNPDAPEQSRLHAVDILLAIKMRGGDIDAYKAIQWWDEEREGPTKALEERIAQALNQP